MMKKQKLRDNVGGSVGCAVPHRVVKPPRAIWISAGSLSWLLCISGNFGVENPMHTVYVDLLSDVVCPLYELET